MLMNIDEGRKRENLLSSVADRQKESSYVERDIFSRLQIYLLTHNLLLNWFNVFV